MGPALVSHMLIEPSSQRLAAICCSISASFFVAVVQCLPLLIIVGLFLFIVLESVCLLRLLCLLVCIVLVYFVLSILLDRGVLHGLDLQKLFALLSGLSSCEAFFDSHVFQEVEPVPPTLNDELPQGCSSLHLMVFLNSALRTFIESGSRFLRLSLAVELSMEFD